MKHVFISYKREERDYVAALASVLEANGYMVWWDFDIPGGESFQDKIKQGLDQAFAIIVVVTPEGENSQWMQNEQFYAAEMKLPLIPLLRQGKLWFRLMNLQAVDGRRNTLDDPVPEGLFAALLQYAPRELPTEIKKKVTNSEQARLRLIPELIELAERVNSPQGLASRELLQQWAALPPDRLSRMACTALEGLPPLPGLKDLVQPNDADLQRDHLPKTSMPERLDRRPEHLPTRPLLFTPKSRRVILGVLGVLLLTGIIAGLVIVLAPSRTPVPTAVELLGNTQDWVTYKEDPPRSTIDVRQNGNFIDVTFDVVEWGYAGIFKRLPAQTLVGTTGIRLTYEGTGNPNTIEVKIIYRQGTVFRVMLRHKTNSDGWITSYELPYSKFTCWPGTGEGEDKCPAGFSLLLNPEKVDRVDLAFSYKHRDEDNPNDLSPEDIAGKGIVRLRSIQAVRE